MKLSKKDLELVKYVNPKKVKNQRNEIIIIVVQYEREFDYLHRILFGTSKVITEYLHENNPYSEIVKVISVNILYFDPGQGEAHSERELERALIARIENQKVIPVTAFQLEGQGL